MSIRNLIFGDNSVTVLYLIRYDRLLQYATEVYYKMRQVFYYKMRQFYYKMQRFYYKMRQLLHIATVHHVLKSSDV